jgi:hypothetical protein
MLAADPMELESIRRSGFAHESARAQQHRCSRATSLPWEHSSPPWTTFCSRESKTPILVKSLVLGVIAIFFFLNEAFAEPWQFQPFVTANGTYTDNVNLDPSGQEKSAVVAQINPGFTVTREGPRLRTDLAYRLQNLFYFRDDTGDESNHQFSGDAEAELVRQRLFLDANATFSQQLINPSGKVSNDNINRTDNTSDTLTYTVSPYLTRNIGVYGDSTLRYAFSKVNYLDDDKEANVDNDVEDSHSHSVDLDVSNIDKEGQRNTWQLQGSWYKEKFSDGEEDKFRKVGLELGYQVTRAFNAFGGGGYEDNDFDRDQSDTRVPSGTFWEVGGRWQPTPRDELEAAFGHRFFGHTGRAQWTHEGVKTTTNVGYSEEITTGNRELANAEFSPGDDINSDVPSSRDQVFLAKRLEATVTHDLPKSVVDVNTYYVKRKFAGSNDGDTAENDRSYGGSLSFEWRYAPRTTFEVTGFYENNHFGGDDPNNTRAGVFAEAQRTIGPRTTGFLRVGHRQQNSDDREDEYDEKFVTLGITRTFF